MTECQKYRKQIDILLDNELFGSALETFLEHLRLCAECQAEFNERRLFLQHIRSIRPLYSASAVLRRRITALLDAGTETSSVGLLVLPLMLGIVAMIILAASMLWRIA